MKLRLKDIPEKTDAISYKRHDLSCCLSDKSIVNERGHATIMLLIFPAERGSWSLLTSKGKNIKVARSLRHLTRTARGEKCKENMDWLIKKIECDANFTASSSGKQRSFGSGRL